MKSQNVTTARWIGPSQYCILAVLIAVVCGSASFARAQSGCKVLFDASDKLIMTPHHGYTNHVTQMKNGKQISSAGEDVSVGGVIYVKVEDAWRKSPMTVPDWLKQEHENRENSKNVSCQHLRDEGVNGEAAGVYTVHAETEDLKSDGTVWISRSRGVILRQDYDADMDGDKSHTTIRYEYANISPPAVSR
ncbi:MAG: hypothetical protein ACRD23_02725 [Terriglobales bacterium]